MIVKRHYYKGDLGDTVKKSNKLLTLAVSLVLLPYYAVCVSVRFQVYFF